MKRLLVIHGPNLNLLGKREPKIYGKLTLEEINKRIGRTAKEEGVSVEVFQSNYEGELVTKIQEAMGLFDALIINPGAYTHTSVAIRDAVVAVGIPTLEIHLSNIYKREDFRRKSMLQDVVEGQITGFGTDSYLLGIKGAVGILKRDE
ncbi:MAG: type II 3-dehydroquinate dehydratase [Thermodesulfobacteriota bacterium]|nr:type II 3-dehydroquinate dehydratase [Thermodesulfobacteriota bacterium]